ncbi:TolB family protein [Synechococcus sp. 7002]|uniref:TolB family protein n=1 Tax=Cyanophyceae TaxID=3028117 RepID=UPI00016DC76C|nr:TolB family protein [Synechococcus sp. 7002]ACA98766.1 WD40-like Beta Propeller Repeat Protein [Picosynechococcus sp. PCC 7002]SMH38886.1 WD40-like Beta Propeller Repeat [Picosynechococcus sp. OG1]SMQ78107.1 WD40-like Beta Propeller Repeat [Synechococcus sp. 7002]
MFRQTPCFLWLLTIFLGLGGCSFGNTPLTPVSLNSRFHDEQPALSGDGRWLAFISNRHGTSELLFYDLNQKQFVELPKLNQKNAIYESPSLSRTGRYLVYLSSPLGKPDIILYDRATQQSDILTQGYRHWVRNPQISPDGRYVVFESARRGQWDIEVLDRGPNIEFDLPQEVIVNPSG